MTCVMASLRGTAKGRRDGTKGRMEFNGEVDEQGTAIKGSCSVVGAQDGAFTMKKRS